MRYQVKQALHLLAGITLAIVSLHSHAVVKADSDFKPPAKVVPLFFSTTGAVSCQGPAQQDKCEYTASRICLKYGYHHVHSFRVYRKTGNSDQLSALSCRTAAK